MILNGKIKGESSGQPLLSLRANVTNNITPPDPIGNALRAAAVAYWKLDEASFETRSDSKGNYDLSDFSSNVTGVAGKINNGAYYDSDNQSLQNDNTVFQVSIDNSFSICFWLKANTYPDPDTNTYIMQHGNIDNAYITLNNAAGDQYITFNVSGDVDTYENYNLPPLGQWALVIAWYSGVDHQAHMLLNNSTDLFLARSGTLTNPRQASGAFMLSDFYSSSASQYTIDEFAIYNKVLSSDERAYLYNSGDGRTLYP